MAYHASISWILWLFPWKYQAYRCSAFIAQCTNCSFNCSVFSWGTKEYVPGKAVRKGKSNKFKWVKTCTQTWRTWTLMLTLSTSMWLGMHLLSLLDRLRWKHHTSGTPWCPYKRLIGQPRRTRSRRSHDAGWDCQKSQKGKRVKSFQVKRKMLRTPDNTNHLADLAHPSSS